MVRFTVRSDHGEPGSLIPWRETGVHSRYPALSCGNDVESSFDENCQVLALWNARLPQRKVNLNIQRDVDRFTAATSRPKLPFLKCLNGVLIQTQSQTAQHLQDLNRAVLADDGRQNDTPLISRSPRIL